MLLAANFGYTGIMDNSRSHSGPNFSLPVPGMQQESH